MPSLDDLTPWRSWGLSNQQGSRLAGEGNGEEAT